MKIAVILLAGIAFYEAFIALQATSDALKMRETLTHAFAIVQSTTMTDEEKAVAMQRSSVAMISSVGLTVAKIAASVAAALLVLFIASRFAWTYDDLLAYSLKPIPLIAVVGGVMFYGMVRHGRKG